MSELTCGGCGGRLIKWGGYWRWFRQRLQLSRVRVPRRRCTSCGITTSLLPSAALVRRLDAVETVGQAVMLRINGPSIRTVAAELDLPATTVRDWLLRHRERAPELERDLTRWAIGLGASPPWDWPRDVDRAAATALGMAWHTACRRWDGRFGGVWRFWSAITGGRALVTNSRPLFAPPRVRTATIPAVPRAPLRVARPPSSPAANRTSPASPNSSPP